MMMYPHAMKRTKDKMIQKAVHIIFALALLLAFAPPANAAKHSAELFLQEHCFKLLVSKND
jgi:hypothetical protein